MNTSAWHSGMTISIPAFLASDHLRSTTTHMTCKSNVYTPILLHSFQLEKDKWHISLKHKKMPENNFRHDFTFWDELSLCGSLFSLCGSFSLSSGGSGLLLSHLLGDSLVDSLLSLQFLLISVFLCLSHLVADFVVALHF